MFLNFAEIIAALGPRAAFRIANAARASAAYLFNTLLPEEPQSTYNVESGNMTIRAVMAGLVGMDSPYPPGGIVEASTFLEQSAKIANEVTLPEAALRRLQELVLRLQASGGTSKEALTNEVLNFTQKVIVQPHLDVMEWLRGQALVTGAIDWTFNKKRLNVDYGVPVANFLTPRTVAATDAYHLAGSGFWADIKALRQALKGNVRAFIAHPDTIEVIRYNPAHAMATVAESNGQITFRRYARDETDAAWPGFFSQDVGDAVTLVSYNREGEVINPADPDSTLILPFMPKGKILAIGNNISDGYRVGQGSVEDDPNAANRLGYTHLAPTVEGGAPGRWAEVFTPEDRPWQLVGRGVTNGLPVIEAPDKIAVATTEMV